MGAVQWLDLHVGTTCQTLDCQDTWADVAAGMKVHGFGDISEMESTRLRSFCWL